MNEYLDDLAYWSTPPEAVTPEDEEETPEYTRADYEAEGSPASPIPAYRPNIDPAPIEDTTLAPVEEESPEADWTNPVRNALKAGADISGGLAKFASDVGHLIEQQLPVGGIAFGDEFEYGFDYKNPEEWKEYQKQYREKYGDEAYILKKFGEALEAQDFGAVEEDTWQNVKDADGILATAWAATNFALEKFPESAAHMAAMATMFPSYIMSRTGTLSNERAANNNREQVTAGDLMAGGSTAVVSAVIDRLGLDKVKALVKGKGVFASALKGTATEATTEAVQEFIEYVGTNLGTEEGFKLAEALDQSLAGAVAGGPVGGAVSGVQALVGETEQQTPPPTTPAEDEGDIDVSDDGKYVVKMPEGDAEAAADKMLGILQSKDAELITAAADQLHELYDNDPNQPDATDIIKEAREAQKKLESAAEDTEKLNEADKKKAEKAAKVAERAKAAKEKKQAKKGGAKKPANGEEARQQGKTLDETPDVQQRQVDAFYNPRSSKNAVLVRPGQEQGPYAQLAKDGDLVSYTVSPEEAAANGDPQASGTYYAHDESVIELIKEGLYSKALNKPGTGKPRQATAVVTSRDKDGGAITTTEVDDTTVNEALAIASTEGEGEPTVDEADAAAAETTTGEYIGPSEETQGKLAAAESSSAQRVATIAENEELFATDEDRGTFTRGEKKGQPRPRRRLDKGVLGGNVSAIHDAIVDDLREAEADGYDVSGIVESIAKVHGVKNLEAKAEAAGVTPLAYLDKQFIKKGKLRNAKEGRASTQKALTEHITDLQTKLTELGAQPEPEGLAERKAAAAEEKAARKAEETKAKEKKLFYPKAYEEATAAGLTSADFTPKGKKITVGEVRDAIKAGEQAVEKHTGEAIKEPAPAKKKAPKKKAAKKQTPKKPKVPRTDRREFDSDAAYDAAVAAGLTARDIGIRSGHKITVPQVRQAVRDKVPGTRKGKKITSKDINKAAKAEKDTQVAKARAAAEAESETRAAAKKEEKRLDREGRALLKKLLGEGVNIRPARILKALGIESAEGKRQIGTIAAIQNVAGHVATGQPLPEGAPEVHQQLFNALLARGKQSPQAKTPAKTPAKTEKKAPSKAETAKKVSKKRSRSKSNVEVISERENPTGFNDRIKALYKVLTGDKRISLQQMRKAAGPTGYSLDAAEFITVLARITSGDKNTENMTAPQIEAMNVLAAKVEAALDNSVAVTSQAKEAGGKSMGRGRVSTAAHTAEQIQESIKDVLERIDADVAQLAHDAVLDAQKHVDLDRTLDAQGVDPEVAAELLDLVSIGNAIQQVDSKVAYDDVFDARAARADALDLASAEAAAVADTPEAAASEGLTIVGSVLADTTAQAESAFLKDASPELAEAYKNADPETKKILLEDYTENTSEILSETGYESIDSFDPNDPDAVLEHWEEAVTFNREAPSPEHARIQDEVVRRRAHVMEKLLPKFMTDGPRDLGQIIKAMNVMLHRNDPLRAIGLMVIRDPQLRGVPVVYDPATYGLRFAEHVGRGDALAAKKAMELASSESRPAGMYSYGRYKGGVIYFNPDTGSSPEYLAQAMETFYHEAVHAATEKELVSNPEFLRDIADLMKQVRNKVQAQVKSNPAVKKWLSSPDVYRSYKYMMSDPAEFITMGMTNPHMTQLLASIKLDKPARAGDGSFVNNMYELFVSIVSRMMREKSGINADPYSAIVHLTRTVDQNQLTNRQREAMLQVRKWRVAQDRGVPMSQIPDTEVTGMLYTYSYDPKRQEVHINNPEMAGEVTASYIEDLVAMHYLVDNPDADLDQVFNDIGNIPDDMRAQIDERADEITDWALGEDLGAIESFVSKVLGTRKRSPRAQSRMRSTSRRLRHYDPAFTRAHQTIDRLHEAPVEHSKATRALTVGGKKSRRTLLKYMPLDNIQRIFGSKVKFHDGDRWVNPVEELIQAMRNRFAEAKNYHRVKERELRIWDLLPNAKDKEVVSQFMLDSTMNEVDGAKTWDQQDRNVKSTAKDGSLDRAGRRRKAAHTEMRERYKKLSTNQQNVYRAVRDYYAGLKEDERNASIDSFAAEYNVPANWVRRFKMRKTKQAIKNLADNPPINENTGKPPVWWDDALKSMDAINDSTQIVGPYFHAGRFGQFAVHVPIEKVSKAFDDEQAARDWAADWSRGDWGRRTKVIQNKETGVWQVEGVDETFELYESEIDAEAAAAEARKKYPGAKSTTLKRLPSMNSAVNAVFNKAQGQAENDQIRQHIFQAMLSMLPEGNIRKSQIHRKKVRGASLDMQRTQAQTIESSGWRLGQLRHGRAVRLADKKMSEAKDYLNPKEASLASDLYNELTERVNMQTESNSRAMMAVGKFGFVWHLLSLSYSVVNSTQPVLLTLPWLGGKYGNTAAANEMRRAYGDVGHEVFKLLTKEALGAKNIAKGQRTEVDQLLDRVANKVLAAGRPDAQAVADMLQALGRDGVIDASFTMLLHETSQFGGSGDHVGSRAMEAARVLPFATEIMNRSVTAIAAYRLHQRNTNATAKESTKFAAEAVRATQFDYSNMNRPRGFIQSDLRRALTMFKIYPLGVYGFMAETVMKMKTPGQRKEGFKTMLTAMLTSSILSGASGMFAEPLRIMTALAANLFDDDDEMQQWLRHPDLWLREVVYQGMIAEGMTHHDAKKWSSAAVYGLPNAADIDLYSRVGYQSLMMQLRTDRDGSIAWGQSATDSLLGPILGKAFTVGKSLDKYEGGDPMGAFVNLMPKGAKDIYNAIDRSERGIRDFNGNVIKKPEEITTWDGWVRAFGFSPTMESDVYHQKRDYSRVMGKIDSGRRVLKKRWRNAETMAERNRIWREEVVPFNKNLPPRAKRVTRGELEKSRVQAKRRERRMVGSVYATKEGKRVMTDVMQKYE